MEWSQLGCDRRLVGRHEIAALELGRLASRARVGTSIDRNPERMGIWHSAEHEKRRRWITGS